MGKLSYQVSHYIVALSAYCMEKDLQWWNTPISIIFIM